ncbi:MAG: VanZ family protein [Gammaproteobacteria bacterium]
MGEISPAVAHLRLGWRVIGICMIGVVWWGCLTPSPPNIPPLFPQFDKLEHFSAYFGLAAWFAAICPQRRQRLAILVLLIGMGAIIEILQHYTGRDAEWFDWLADILGALLGLAWPAVWLGRAYRYLVRKYA